MSDTADGPSRHEDQDPFVLAVLLAALAGWVDALGYLRFHGLFVSFMSGNSTQAAVAVARHDHGTALEAARAILVFVAGVVLGEVIRPPAGRHGRALVLAVEAMLLSAALEMRDAGEPLVTSLLGLAMGLQNASVHQAGGIKVALTYVTGTLVSLGRTVAAALRGAGPWSAPVPLLALWAALVLGGLGGAVLAQSHATVALLAAALAAWCLALALLANTRRA